VNDISGENIWNGKSWKVRSVSGVGEKDSFFNNTHSQENIKHGMEN